MAEKIEDIRKESLIRKKWNFSKSSPSNYASGILVTGANSFVGTHVVQLLQRNWKGPIHLLIRAGNKDEAIQKMMKAFLAWGLGSFPHGNFVIHLGDVCDPMMGLSSIEHEALNKDVGFVLHLAMNPLYHLPYAHFKRLWLPELNRMIAFCGDKSSPKSLHYPSSYNANFFVTDEDFRDLNSNGWQSGYAGFKWVTNKIIKNAFNQNLKGCLYDIPLVVGSQEKGLCPSHYSIWIILDMFLKTGVYIDFEFKIIPVDVLAEIIVTNLLNDEKNEGETYVRPVMKESVSEILFGKVAAFLGLKHSDPGTLRDLFYSKRRFDFMIPSNFYELLNKVNILPPIIPTTLQDIHLPSTPMVLLSNLNTILSKKKETEFIN